MLGEAAAQLGKGCIEYSILVRLILKILKRCNHYWAI